MEDTAQDIVQDLNFNILGSRIAAICKILRSHPDIDVETLFRWKMSCLPLIVDWLEKAEPYLIHVHESTDVFKNRQLSAVYKFVRGMPLLAANGYRKQEGADVQSKKRKLDQTLDGGR